MVILRAGLCPGLTAEMIQLLKANSIATVVDLVSSDLEEVARKCCLSYKVEALQRIQVARVFDVYKMLDVLQELRCSVSQQVLSSSGPVKVLVVDSVSAVICPLLGGRQAEGLALMMQLARELKTLARELSMAVVVTNHVTRDGSSGHLKPALGRSWSFVPSTRVLLESREGTWGQASTRRIASLTKSPRQPTGIEVELDIGSCGVLEESPAASGEGR
ncbi:DNA repair protein RAD51 homolog 4 isoform X2 [Emys orbicularis]|uniref:DNA repair protein RAD51 homolog 4 isoform X2 n=1 Tax=Emys orbicularis TaxID=82168 RepID=UPI0031FD043D